MRVRVFIGGAHDQTLANAGVLMVDAWQWDMMREGGLRGDVEHGVDVEFVDENQEKSNADIRQEAGR